LRRDVRPGRLPARPADPRCGGHVQPLQLGDHLLHRTAGGRLDDEEIERQDAQQSRNDEGETPENVGEHWFQIFIVSFLLYVDMKAWISRVA
jgi:hypothetical protein